MKRVDLHFPGIYKFTNKVNGKVYVGQSVNIFKRLAGHKRLRGNMIITNAFRCYGFEAFDFEVLERVDDLTRLDGREQYWMDYYKSSNREYGYNLSPTAGSQRGFKYSPEHIKKMVETGKRLYANGHRPFVGRVLSPEAIERVREKNKKWRPSPEQRAKFLQNNKPPTREQAARFGQLSIEKFRYKIQQIDAETGEVVKVWESLNDIKNNSDFGHYQVSGACRGYYWGSERKEYIAYDTYKGYRWQYLTEQGKLIRPRIPKTVFSPNGKIKKIAQINLVTGETIKVWDSVENIEIELGLKKAGVQNTCRGKWYDNRRKAYVPKLCYAGFKWQYVY